MNDRVKSETVKDYEWAMRDVPRIHLTLCGVEAGRPLCGCDKQAELKTGCLFFHAVYAPEKVFSDTKRLCPKCKAEWDAAV